jgi:hypothetical protein
LQGGANAIKQKQTARTNDQMSQKKIRETQKTMIRTALTKHQMQAGIRRGSTTDLTSNGQQLSLMFIIAWRLMGINFTMQLTSNGQQLSLMFIIAWRLMGINFTTELAPDGQQLSLMFIIAYRLMGINFTMQLTSDGQQLSLIFITSCRLMGINFTRPNGWSRSSSISMATRLLAR